MKHFFPLACIKLLSQELLLAESTLLLGDKWFLCLNCPCKFSLDLSYPIPAGTRVRKKMLGIKVEVRGKKSRCVEH